MFINALAMATRCCSPPDSSDGLWVALSASPSVSRSSAALFFASDSLAPFINAGIITFSSDVNSGSRWWNWNTNPIFLLRNVLISLRLRVVTSVPSMRSVPLSGVESVPSICSKVDLPAPEAPMMDTTSDFSALKSMPLSTFRLPNDFSIPLASIIISVQYISAKLRNFIEFFRSLPGFKVNVSVILA